MKSTRDTDIDVAIAEVNIGIKWWISTSLSNITLVNNCFIIFYELLATGIAKSFNVRLSLIVKKKKKKKKKKKNAQRRRRLYL